MNVKTKHSYTRKRRWMNASVQQIVGNRVAFPKRKKTIKKPVDIATSIARHNNTCNLYLWGYLKSPHTETSRCWRIKKRNSRWNCQYTFGSDMPCNGKYTRLIRRAFREIWRASCRNNLQFSFFISLKNLTLNWKSAVYIPCPIQIAESKN